MTQSEAESMLKQALPCPFCGEKLVIDCVHDNKIFVLKHSCDGPECVSDYSSFEISDELELKLWNTRRG